MPWHHGLCRQLPNIYLLTLLYNRQLPSVYLLTSLYDTQLPNVYLMTSLYIIQLPSVYLMTSLYNIQLPSVYLTTLLYKMQLSSVYPIRDLFLCHGISFYITAEWLFYTMTSLFVYLLWTAFTLIWPQWLTWHKTPSYLRTAKSLLNERCCSIPWLNYLLQLSHYLDTVEVQIARQISTKSEAFFHAMTSHDELQDQLSNTLKTIKHLRCVLPN